MRRGPRIVLEDALGGGPLAEFPPELAEQECVPAPDGTRLAAIAGDVLQLKSAANGVPVGPPVQLPGRIRSFAWSPDGGTIAAGFEDGSIELLRGQDGGPRARLAGDGHSVRSLSLSSDGSRLAAAFSDEKVRLWDHQSLALDIDLERDAPASVALSPDGRRLAIGHRCAIQVVDLDRAFAPASEIRSAIEARTGLRIDGLDAVPRGG